MSGPQPTLVYQEEPNSQVSEANPLMIELSPDQLRDLVLVQRYEGRHSRDMYRALSVLLALRRGGEAALGNWGIQMLGGDQALEEA